MKSFAIDPLASPVLLPVMTRTGQEVELMLSMSGRPGDPAMQFKGTVYHFAVGPLDMSCIIEKP